MQGRAASLGPRDLLIFRRREGRAENAKSGWKVPSPTMPSSVLMDDMGLTPPGKVAEPHRQHAETRSKLVTQKPIYLSLFLPPNTASPIQRCAQLPPHAPRPRAPIPTSTLHPSPALACRIPVLAPVSYALVFLIRSSDKNPATLPSQTQSPAQLDWQLDGNLTQTGH